MPFDPHGHQPIAASQSNKLLGAKDVKGAFLQRLVIIPGTTSPGAVAIKDGSDTAITVFTGGASSVADLTPIVIDLEIRSVDGGWKITTGANVTALATGHFQ